MQLKILGWNIRGSSSTGWSNKRIIEKEIVDELIAQDADILVINEFILSTGWDYFQQEMLKKQYVWFINLLSTENGLLIVVKENLLGNKKLYINQMYKEGMVFNEKNLNSDVCPNFIHVKLPELNIIGIRVRTLANYTNRKEQVLSVTNYIESKKLKKVLFLGDFNNSTIKGDSTKCYEEVREEYHWTSKNEVSDLYDTYNYHILKELLPKDFSIYTPEGY